MSDSKVDGERSELIAAIVATVETWPVDKDAPLADLRRLHCLVRLGSPSQLHAGPWPDVIMVRDVDPGGAGAVRRSYDLLDVAKADALHAWRTVGAACGARLPPPGGGRVVPLPEPRGSGS